jgi:hypothetical protein
MKIIIFYDEQNAAKAEELNRTLPHESAEFHLAPLIADFEQNENLFNLLDEATHIAVISDTMPACLAYLEGFSVGKKSYIVCLLPKTIIVPPLFKKLSKVFNETTEFLANFNKEIDRYTKKESISSARSEILHNGIPVSTESFAASVSKGEISFASLFLKAGFSVNDQDRKGVPLLCLAARSGNPDMVSFLMKKGADPNRIAADRGNSAILDAALGKHSDIIDFLIKSGARVDIKSKDGQSALTIAVGLNDEKSATLLLQAGANADEPDSLGASARKYAMMFHKEGMVKLFEQYAPQTAAK